MTPLSRIARIILWTIRSLCALAAVTCLALSIASYWREPRLKSEGNCVFGVSRGALIGWRNVFPFPAQWDPKLGIHVT